MSALAPGGQGGAAGAMEEHGGPSNGDDTVLASLRDALAMPAAEEGGAEGATLAPLKLDEHGPGLAQMENGEGWSEIMQDAGSSSGSRRRQSESWGAPIEGMLGSSGEDGVPQTRMSKGGRMFLVLDDLLSQLGSPYSLSRKDAPPYWDSLLAGEYAEAERSVVEVPEGGGLMVEWIVSPEGATLIVFLEREAGRATGELATCMRRSISRAFPDCESIESLDLRMIAEDDGLLEGTPSEGSSDEPARDLMIVDAEAHEEVRPSSEAAAPFMRTPADAEGGEGGDEEDGKNNDVDRQEGEEVSDGVKHVSPRQKHNVGGSKRKRAEVEDHATGIDASDDGPECNTPSVESKPMDKEIRKERNKATFTADGSAGCTEGQEAHKSTAGVHRNDEFAELNRQIGQEKQLKQHYDRQHMQREKLGAVPVHNGMGTEEEEVEDVNNLDSSDEGEEGDDESDGGEGASSSESSASNVRASSALHPSCADPAGTSSSSIIATMCNGKSVVRLSSLYEFLDEDTAAVRKRMSCGVMHAKAYSYLQILRLHKDHVFRGNLGRYLGQPWLSSPESSLLIVHLERLHGRASKDRAASARAEIERVFGRQRLEGLDLDKLAKELGVGDASMKAPVHHADSDGDDELEGSVLTSSSSGAVVKAAMPVEPSSFVVTTTADDKICFLLTRLLAYLRKKATKNINNPQHPLFQRLQSVEDHLFRGAFGGLRGSSWLLSPEGALLVIHSELKTGKTGKHRAQRARAEILQTYKGLENLDLDQLAAKLGIDDSRVSQAKASAGEEERTLCAQPPLTGRELDDTDEDSEKHVGRTEGAPFSSALPGTKGAPSALPPSIVKPAGLASSSIVVKAKRCGKACDLVRLYDYITKENEHGGQRIQYKMLGFPYFQQLQKHEGHIFKDVLEGLKGPSIWLASPEAALLVVHEELKAERASEEFARRARAVILREFELNGLEGPEAVKLWREPNLSDARTELKAKEAAPKSSDGRASPTKSLCTSSSEMDEVDGSACASRRDGNAFMSSSSSSSKVQRQGRTSESKAQSPKPTRSRRLAPPVPSIETPPDLTTKTLAAEKPCVDARTLYAFMLVEEFNARHTWVNFFSRRDTRYTYYRQLDKKLSRASPFAKGFTGAPLFREATLANQMRQRVNLSFEGALLVIHLESEAQLVVPEKAQAAREAILRSAGRDAVRLKGLNLQLLAQNLGLHADNDAGQEASDDSPDNAEQDKDEGDWNSITLSSGPHKSGAAPRKRKRGGGREGDESVEAPGKDSAGAEDEPPARAGKKKAAEPDRPPAADREKAKEAGSAGGGKEKGAVCMSADDEIAQLQKSIQRETLRKQLASLERDTAGAQSEKLESELKLMALERQKAEMQKWPAPGRGSGEKAGAWGGGHSAR